jgi:hypothetical protein
MKENFEPVPDCIINDMFIDANEPVYERLRYCEENCGYKCISAKSYKKREDDKL